MEKKGGNMSDNTRWQEFNSIIDNEILQPKEKLLSLTIFRFYNSEKGYSYPSKETLKKLCGISHDRDYYKYIKNLEDKKILIKETVKGKGCKFYNKFDADLVNNQILALDNYIANGKGKKYKDHYRVLNTWCTSKQPKQIKGQISIDDCGIREF